MGTKGFILYNGVKIAWNPDYYRGWIKIQMGPRSFYTNVVVHKGDIVEYRDNNDLLGDMS